MTQDTSSNKLWKARVEVRPYTDHGVFYKITTYVRAHDLCQARARIIQALHAARYEPRILFTLEVTKDSPEEKEILNGQV